MTSIYESARGIKDEQIIEIAVKYDFLLLTEDKDFGEWVFAIVKRLDPANGLA